MAGFKDEWRVQAAIDWILCGCEARYTEIRVDKAESSPSVLSASFSKGIDGVQATKEIG